MATNASHKMPLLIGNPGGGGAGGGGPDGGAACVKTADRVASKVKVSFFGMGFIIVKYIKNFLIACLS
ncbi:hypothetical protein O8E88_001902 [Flavobacterium psychrophilum]|uniref:hypothetical protein n=1 Tax=Flavobacterium psychrophilum TaxID=96345 RepID=UPI0008773B7A|nr:hypothetical protein [Flavobacterium psychrophilum]EKT2070086.1 hypothetical protein [Flavobacterium psychrophilum]EKT2072219.1 hypothetical protein [Flavobacterium psychrophilum]EKT4491647.1 hypothetical protein [Flavobacterium psychrophilum]MBF2045188.1 hypothetical protein [Flavobacterium psychrophilum]SCY03871.1 hypothetical protein SAMN02745938_10696 [Flavobacterium psychrophilum DSM 3660] [Flavobacterium psychrophilum DSM 3660 = ATCC 49418]